MVHKDASSMDHLRLRAPTEPAQRQNPASSLRSITPEVPLRSNLPMPLTSFVGRGAELVAVQQCLAEARLVTLVGTGGVGKTRLALSVAEEAIERFPDGSWLVELGPLADPTLVPQIVAAALCVRDQAGVSIVQSLKQALHFRRMLLLLDNCEHLAQVCAELVEDLLRGCPNLRILATSREPLGVAGEVAWRVPSLAVPDVGAAMSEHLNAYAAMRLFVERAVAAKPDFRVTDQNTPAIVEVCRRLDGIPLALELAAARVRLLSVEQIATRLDDRFRLLSGGPRTAPPRQQTLRATVDWSYALLQEPERRLFHRLAAFAGGWTLEAAEAICAGTGIESTEVLDRLGHLVDHSLVMVDEEAGQIHYRLLETMRQYATERLEESGESATIRGRHRDWFLAKAESSPFELFDPDHVAWLATELDNLRVALRWSIQTGDMEEGLRLATRISAFWYQRGSSSEARMWFAELQAQARGTASPALAAALIWAAGLMDRHGDPNAARGLLRESRAIARQLGDAASVASGLFHEAGIALRAGDIAQAQLLSEEGLSVSRTNALSTMEYYHLMGLGLAALEGGYHTRAATLGAECLALAERIGHARGSVNALYILGRAAVGRGDHVKGRDLLDQSLARYRQYSDLDGMLWSLRGLGHLALDQGDATAARSFFRESLALAHDGGDRWELARSLEGLAGASVEARPERTVQLAGAGW